MTRTEEYCRTIRLKIPLRVRIAKSATLEHTRSLNVSTRGISFATDCPLQGTPVHLAFRCQKKSHSRVRMRLRSCVTSAEQFSAGDLCGRGFDCYESCYRPAPSESNLPNRNELMIGATPPLNVPCREFDSRQFHQHKRTDMFHVLGLRKVERRPAGIRAFVEGLENKKPDIWATEYGTEAEVRAS